MVSSSIYYIAHFAWSSKAITIANLIEFLLGLTKAIDEVANRLVIKCEFKFDSAIGKIFYDKSCVFFRTRKVKLLAKNAQNLLRHSMKICFVIQISMHVDNRRPNQKTFWNSGLSKNHIVYQKDALKKSKSPMPRIVIES